MDYRRTRPEGGTYCFEEAVPMWLGQRGWGSLCSPQPMGLWIYAMCVDDGPSILDGLHTLPIQLRQPIAHGLELFRRVTDPAIHFGDDA